MKYQTEHYIEAARDELENPSPDNMTHKNLDALAGMLEKPYRFTVYAANDKQCSVNFGLVVTYRQLWEPRSYQVGELVKTVPLAPKEVRRFTKKVAVRQSRAEKEVENNLQKRDREAKETSRIESEIVQKALNNTNFKLSAEGGVGIGFAHASGQSAFAQDAATDVAGDQEGVPGGGVQGGGGVQAGAHDRDQCHAWGEDIMARSRARSAIPNDEIPVTYLFYELQRRYRVSEQIHRLPACRPRRTTVSQAKQNHGGTGSSQTTGSCDG